MKQLGTQVVGCLSLGFCSVVLSLPSNPVMRLPVLPSWRCRQADFSVTSPPPLLLLLSRFWPFTISDVLSFLFNFKKKKTLLSSVYLSPTLSLSYCSALRLSSPCRN